MASALCASSRRTRLKAAGGRPPPTPGAPRARVLEAIEHWVAAGIATLSRRGGSRLELRFITGEVWRLEANGIIREK
jgi:hypothetical protein